MKPTRRQMEQWTPEKESVVRAAIRWFNAGRPLSMPKREHVVQYCVNRCGDDRSRALAKACARLARGKL